MNERSKQDAQIIAMALRKIESLKSDCMVMALRLMGESTDTFSPETKEVMDRLKIKAEFHINNGGEK